jgi:nucleoside-diphosphate-sugar epimerase
MFTNKILITGATGFVGQVLVSSFLTQNKTVRALVRSSSSLLPSDVQPVIGDLTGLVGSMPDQKLHNELLSALEGVEVVVHSAARAHIMQEQSADPLEVYRKVNRDATLVLARMAAAAGVKRFVFLSSIKVNGEMTRPGYPFYLTINIFQQILMDCLSTKPSRVYWHWL